MQLLLDLALAKPEKSPRTTKEERNWVRIQSYMERLRELTGGRLLEA
jgi:hypothetical protein